MTELSVIGKSVPRVDAFEKVTGKADFVVNFQLPNMLSGKVLRSPYAHARIISIDASKAEKLPGVKAVATATNTPPISIGSFVTDVYVFPADLKVRYVGDGVAALAAETEEIAEEAIDLIDVEYEELPAVFDTEEAFRTDPPAIVHPNLSSYQCNYPGVTWRLVPERPNVCNHFKVRHGSMEKRFEEADLIVENRYAVPRVHHSQMEPQVCVVWVAPDGTLTVKSSTQGIWLLRNEICRSFGLTPSNIRVECHYSGGGFGGKVGAVAEPYAVLLTLKCGGRPVKICYTRAEHFSSARSRVPVVTYIKDGAKKDGTLVAREATILVDMGAYANQALKVSMNAVYGLIGTYKIPNFKLDSYAVYTNTPLSGPFRGFGSAETIWAGENQLDIIAHELGLDPVEVRMKNILREGDINGFGEVTHSIGTRKCLEKVTKWIEWNKKPPAEKGPWKRGKGIALSNKYTRPGAPSCALVKVHPDGVIEVRHSSDELGQGLNTVVAQIAAESFGVSMDYVRVVNGDTAVCPYGWPPISSRETFYMGNAVLAACADAKRQVFEIAASKLGVPVVQLETRDRMVCVKGHPGKEIKIEELFRPAGLGNALMVGEIMGKGLFELPGIPEDPETGQSKRMVTSFSHGALAVEIAVNVETGELKVLKCAGCFDGGQPINPEMCKAQIEGGINQGIGIGVYEEMVMEGGVLLNPNFADYKLPTICEMPDIENVALMLAGAPHREGPFGAKGIGEGIMIPWPPAMSNAIYNAVGVRIKELPLNREKILNALKEKEATKDRV